MGPDPRAIVDALHDWARDTDWVEWVELGGSLGRGAGDAFSDVDAGIGVTGLDDHALDGRVLQGDAADDRDPEAPAPEDAAPGDHASTGSAPTGPDPRAAETLAAISAFAPLAARLEQRIGGLLHFVCVYEDGRQLSLVLFDAAARAGLAPQSTAVLDKTGRLAAPLDPGHWTPSGDELREWTFLAWIDLGDAARHRHRDHPWRALRSLTDARDHLWKLHAARLGLTYPAFGAVTVENADAPPPPGIAATHPTGLGRNEFHTALTALAGLLDAHTGPDLRGLAAAIRPRFDLLA
ncbi:hypothetical protein GCM10009853_026190 [Glycomyces scopariae]